MFSLVSPQYLQHQQPRSFPWAMIIHLPQACIQQMSDLVLSGAYHSMHGALLHILFCSHYLLIAVPVSKSQSDPLTAPYQPIVPLKNLLFKALSSKKMVTTISQPLPFIVASFEPTALPVNYKFGYEWRSVFKQKTHYSVVLAAFTKGKVRYN